MRKDKIFMLVGSLLLLFSFVFPLWKITLLAPQYPEPLGMKIYITHLADGNQFNDVKNIDLLNHYIGMAHLPYKANVEKGVVKPFKEFVIIPIVIVVLVILGLITTFIGKRKYYIYWLVLLIISGIIGILDFYNWLYVYGHNLDPNAILKITDKTTGKLMAYQPPLFGFKQMLNFQVYSYPSTAVYFIGLSVIFVLLAIKFYPPKGKNLA
ncbi:hypothetical protein [Tenacibaculum sp. UWU-22]|uniref:hypothetical protein n=1 Tax=Tenacibaculum sp. UWU-22 TaxID=3234187 RepID=UPI0034DAFE49